MQWICRVVMSFRRIGPGGRPMGRLRRYLGEIARMKRALALVGLAIRRSRCFAYEADSQFSRQPFILDVAMGLMFAHVFNALRVRAR